ncbi:MULTISPECIES: DUF4148 domain-containing protein [Janthinobacterium]|uniref:DUF4148 domain-containing protein n=1 Tax=Janthinobacterium rivuli TaxID=2751478 RepID=A0ABY8IAU4_9BURK|nr:MULTISPECIES: DUF4148 domain-containing protein [Janthinobacterium]MCA1862842.1 DUF4148 domain-containing protein [Janthinobacterium lividum]NVI82113.1 DUF4148 domain-containing protein [Janthinobacterium sp. BJB401]WFR81155.1 DUF4148 domain-containing protein [Janthinobacterium rivuli]
MQAKSLIAALFAITTATSAFAQSAAPAPTDKQLTREQVTAEYIRARNAGEIATSEVDYPKTPATAASQVTREQVMAEFYAARKAGLIPQTEADFDIAHTIKQVVQ